MTAAFFLLFLLFASLPPALLCAAAAAAASPGGGRRRVEASLSLEKQTARAPRALSVGVTLDGEARTVVIEAGATAQEAANAFLSKYLADHANADFPMEMVHATLADHFVKRIVEELELEEEGEEEAAGGAAEAVGRGGGDRGGGGGGGGDRGDRGGDMLGLG